MNRRGGRTRSDVTVMFVAVGLTVLVAFVAYALVWRFVGTPHIFPRYAG